MDTIDNDDEVVVNFREGKNTQHFLGDRENKELEKFSYQINQYVSAYAEQGKEKADQIYKYFKEDRKDLSIVAAAGAVIGALGYAATEVASKISSSMITSANHLNLANPHIHGAVHKIIPVAKHVPIRIAQHIGHAGDAVVHHGGVMVHHGAHTLPITPVIHHGGVVVTGASHAAGITATLLPLFTATVISATVAMVCYELYQRNEKDMAKYVTGNLNNSPELNEYINEVGKDSGAIDRFKKGEYPGFKDITLMTELTGRYLYGKSADSMAKLNDQAQTMISSISKYLSSVKERAR